MTAHRDNESGLRQRVEELEAKLAKAQRRVPVRKVKLLVTLITMTVVFAFGTAAEAVHGHVIGAVLLGIQGYLWGAAGWVVGARMAGWRFPINGVNPVPDLMFIVCTLGWAAALPILGIVLLFRAVYRVADAG